MSESKERAYERKLVKRLIIKARKRARRQENTIYLNAGLMGVFGWHIVVPMILGALIGVAFDHLCQTGYLCFIIMLLTGIAAGLYNAYRWLRRHLDFRRKSEEVILESEQKKQSEGEE